MKIDALTTGFDACRCCLSRRRFLAGCGACGAATLALPRAVASPAEGERAERPRVRLVFACWALVQDRPTWPNIGHDMRPEIERVTKSLQQGCPEVEFLPEAAHSPEDAARILAKHDGDRIDGYIVYQMNNWIQVFPRIVAAGKPTLVADFSFAGSGGFLLYTAGLREKHSNFSVVSSRKLDDLVAAARCFTLLKTEGVKGFVAACDRVRKERTPPYRDATVRDDSPTFRTPGQCIEALRKSVVLSLGGGNKAVAQALGEQFGLTVKFIAFEELAEAAAQADADQVTAVASRWKSAAKKIEIDQPDDTLLKSARNYLGQRALLQRHNAEAITINCLGGFYSGKLNAYPCLAFVELLNEGLIGACEADLLSTGTMVAMRHLAGRPGFISDPVLDTSSRQAIYAHCVAMTKPFGPEDSNCNFEILTHSEDRRGASVRSYLPIGYRVSTMEIHPIRKEILFHAGRSVENVLEDRACRTKLACEVDGDFEKLFTFWDKYGWHRVSFYGDLREPVKELAAAVGFRFVEEA